VIKTDLPRIDPNTLNKAVIDESIAKFRSAVRRDPTDETAHYGLGVAYFNLGLLVDAVEELTQAARLMPENPHIQTQLAAVLARRAEKGDPDAERLTWDRLNRALLLQPSFVPALLLKAEMHLRRGDRLLAAKAWRQASALDPDAIRAPVAKFLKSNSETAVQTSRFSTGVQRIARRRQLERDRRRYSVLALAAFLGSCVLMTALSAATASEVRSASAGAVSMLPMLALAMAVVLPITIYQFGKRKHREAIAELESPMTLSAEEQAYFNGQTPRAEDLVDVADEVVLALNRAEAEAADAARRPRALMEVSSGRGREDRRSSASAEKRRLAAKNAGCTGCGTRLLLMFAVASVMVGQWLL